MLHAPSYRLRYWNKPNISAMIVITSTLHAPSYRLRYWNLIMEYNRKTLARVACTLLPFTVLKLLPSCELLIRKVACTLLPFTVLKLDRFKLKVFLTQLHAPSYRLRYWNRWEFGVEITRRVACTLLPFTVLKLCWLEKMRLIQFRCMHPLTTWGIDIR